MKDMEYSAHGISFSEYLRLDTIPVWIKVLFYLIEWYIHPKHKGSVFFQKYSTIERWFRRCGVSGYRNLERDIRDAFYILEDLELIKKVYASGKKSESENPNAYIYRKVYLNWNRIHKYLSIFTTEGAFKNLKAKSRLKKLVQCRFLSYTKKLQVAFEKAMKEAVLEKYETAKKMFYGFLYKISSKYYNVKRLIYNFIPEHERNLQKEQDEEEWIRLADSSGIFYKLDVGSSSESTRKTPPKALLDFFNRI